MGNLDRLGPICYELATLVASSAISLPIAGECGLDQYVDALTLASKLHGKVSFHPNGKL